MGSMPGTSPDEAIAVVLGELPDLPHLPELPARGPGADLIGRTAALLVDLPVETTARGWRLAERRGRDQRRAGGPARRGPRCCPAGGRGLRWAVQDPGRRAVDAGRGARADPQHRAGPGRPWRGSRPDRRRSPRGWRSTSRRSAALPARPSWSSSTSRPAPRAGRLGADRQRPAPCRRGRRDRRRRRAARRAERRAGIRRGALLRAGVAVSAAWPAPVPEPSPSTSACCGAGTRTTSARWPRLGLADSRAGRWTPGCETA